MFFLIILLNSWYEEKELKSFQYPTIFNCSLLSPRYLSGNSVEERAIDSANKSLGKFSKSLLLFREMKFKAICQKYKVSEATLTWCRGVTNNFGERQRSHSSGRKHSCISRLAANHAVITCFPRVCPLPLLFCTLVTKLQSRDRKRPRGQSRQWKKEIFDLRRFFIISEKNNLKIRDNHILQSMGDIEISITKLNKS